MPSVSNYLKEVTSSQALNFVSQLKPSISWFGGRHFTHPDCSGYLCMSEIVLRMQKALPVGDTNVSIYTVLSNLNEDCYALLSKCSFVVRALTVLKQLWGQRYWHLSPTQRDSQLVQNEASPHYICYRSACIPRERRQRIMAYQTSFTVDNRPLVETANAYRGSEMAIIDITNAAFPELSDPALSPDKRKGSDSLLDNSATVGSVLINALKAAKGLRTKKQEEEYIPKNGCLCVPGTKYKIGNCDTIHSTTVCITAPDFSAAKVAPGFQDKEYCQLIKNKMRSALHAADISNCRTLIIGTVGFQTHKHNPVVVAGIIKELFDTEFKGFFQNVHFVVKGDDTDAQTAFQNEFPRR
jgi:hypothetical protein